MVTKADICLNYLLNNDMTIPLRFSDNLSVGDPTQEIEHMMVLMESQISF